jgi:hypothetical protein
MAGELDKENGAALQQKVGGKIGNTELYLAHFLGAGGASEFIRQMRQNSQVSAADILPSAASANQSVFYTKTGQARSVQQIYQQFAQKFDGSLTQAVSRTSKSVTTGSVRPSFAVASASQISMDLASLMPTETAATSEGSSADTISGLRSRAKTGGINLASAGTSTLFDAMIYGQTQGTRLNSPSPISVFNEQADSKKKNAYSVLSAIV